MARILAARVLVIAGSDSSGGAGIQADIKTITMLGGYAATAITALTAQNTQGVHGIYPVPKDFIKQQIATTLEDIGADVIKIGMLGDSETIQAVKEAIAPALQSGVQLVLDPVMVAKGGSVLLPTEAVASLKSALLPLANLITPNLEEAAHLSGQETTTKEKCFAAAHKLQNLGARNVLITGGKEAAADAATETKTLFDLLLNESGAEEVFSHKRQDTKNTHGTGCTLASAIATGLAQGLSLSAAITRAIDFVQRAISANPKLGKGHGPLGHAQVK